MTNAANTNAANELNAAAKAAQKEARRKASRAQNDAAKAEAAAARKAEAEAAEAAAREAAAKELENAEASAKTLREQAAEAQKQLCDAIAVRIEHAPNANFAKNMHAELRALSGTNAMLAIEKCIALEVDFDALARAYATTDKNSYDYIAIYAAQKVRKSLFALATGMTSVFDGYTQAIMRNLVKLESLSNRGSQISLSNKVVFTEDMQSQAVRSFKLCEPSTASTQASSTRQAMRFLNVCNVIKSRKDDSMTLTDSKAAQAVQAMFKAV
jgi:hypothetical protein